MQTLSDSLRQGIYRHAKELKDARAVIDGDLVRQIIRYHVWNKKKKFCFIHTVCLSIYQSIYYPHIHSGHLALYNGLPIYLIFLKGITNISHIAGIVLSSNFRYSMVVKIILKLIYIFINSSRISQFRCKKIYTVYHQIYFCFKRHEKKLEYNLN